MGRWIRKIPLIGTVIDFIWLSLSIFKKSIYSPASITDNPIFKSITPINHPELSKFYCCVYNITQKKEQYINGSHPLLKEYLLASLSLWLVFPPIFIKQLSTECQCTPGCPCDKTKPFCTCTDRNHSQNEFIDGAFLHFMPVEIDPTYDGTYLIITTKDIQKIKRGNIALHTGSNLLSYMDELITYHTSYNQYLYLKHIQDWTKLPNVHLISCDLNTDPTDTDKKNINSLIEQGKKTARVITTYHQSHKSSSEHPLIPHALHPQPN